MIAVNIYGDIEALLGAWSAPAGVALERSADDSASLIFSGDNLSRYGELEGAIARLAPTHELTLDAYYRSVDFSVDDLRASELLWMRIPMTPGLEVISEAPIELVRCDLCHRMKSVRHDVSRVQLLAEDMPTRTLIAAASLNFASRELLARLVAAGFNAGLCTIPCSLATHAKTVDEASYSFIAGSVDLGDPQGDVSYGDACPGCGQRRMAGNRSFLWAFARDHWTGEDFCTSSFFGLDTIYVSQRVYRLLEKSHAEAIFEPIELI